MFDYENQTEAVRKLMDDAAFYLYAGTLDRNIALREEASHRRQTRRGHVAETNAARGMSKASGIELAVARLLGASRTEVRRTVYARAQELYGPADGWCRA